MLERKGNVLFNDALNTFYLRLYGYNFKKSLFDVNTLSSSSFNGCLGCFKRMSEWKGMFLFNDALNTFLFSYMVIIIFLILFDVNTLSSSSFNGCLGCFTRMSEWKEGNVLFNDTLNTFYLQLYDII